MENLIIHISGASGSGKTTLGNKLKENFKSKIVVKDLDELIDEFIQNYYGNKSFTYIDKLKLDISLENGIGGCIHKVYTKEFNNPIPNPRVAPATGPPQPFDPSDPLKFQRKLAKEGKGGGKSRKTKKNSRRNRRKTYRK
jgi:hypothetical protein